MSYADYDFYKNTYKGKLSEEDFSFLAERASDLIDGYTDYFIVRYGFDSLSDEVKLRVKKCCCALADAFKTAGTYDVSGSHGAVTSEKVGDYSVSYASSSTVSYGQNIENILFMYLPDIAKAAKWV